MTTRTTDAIAARDEAKPAASHRNPSSYATRLSRDAIRFERLLPGPIERVWAYLTDSEKRGKWLASGEMPPRVGAEMTLTFAHADLSPHKAPTPDKFKKFEPSVSSQHRVLRYEPTRFLSITFGDANDPSEVDFELTPEGDKVRLVLTHRRLGRREAMLSVSAGWHTHLAVLEERLNERVPPSFWTLYEGLDKDYERRYEEEDKRFQ